MLIQNINKQLDSENSTSSSAAIRTSAHGALLEMATMQRLREKHGLIAVPALATRATPQTESVHVSSHSCNNKQQPKRGIPFF
jgi:hypothetical protein